MPFPPGWVSDATTFQRAAIRNYFSNYKDVGFRQSIITANNFVDIATPYTVTFPRPFIFIGRVIPAQPIMTNNPATNAAVYPWGVQQTTTAQQFAAMAFLTKLFQCMQECTVNNEPISPMGASVDGSVGFNALPGGTNFNYYFNNYTSKEQVDNLNALLMPLQTVEAFWRGYNTLGTNINVVYGQQLVLMLQFIQQFSDLRLWGTPGVYTINPANLAPYMVAMSAIMNARPTFMILEQKSIE